MVFRKHKKESKWLTVNGRKVRCYLCGRKILRSDERVYHDETGYYAHQSCDSEIRLIDRNGRRKAVKVIAATGAVAGAIALGVDKLENLPFGKGNKSNTPLETVITEQGIIPPSLTSDPANPVPGQIWYRSDAGVLAHYDAVQNRVVYSSEINDGNVNVTSKGIINGLSVLPNDGKGGFGPDTMLGSTAPGQYGSPYTQTSGIQEALNYAGNENIATVYLSSGIFVLNAGVSLVSNVNLIGTGGLWNPATVAYPIPASDIPSNVTVITAPSTVDTSKYPLTSMMSGTGSINGLVFQNITLNLQGVGLQGINIDSTVGAPTQQNSAWFIGVTIVNIAAGYVGIGLLGGNEINNMLLNCQFDGPGNSVSSNNDGSLIWLYNVQDYTDSGFSFNNVYVYIIGGIQQRVSISQCDLLSITEGSFTNANANVGIIVGSQVEMIVLKRTGILIPTSSFINTASGANTVSSLSMEDCTLDTSVGTEFVDSLSAIKKWTNRNTLLLTSSTPPTNFPFYFIPTAISGHSISSTANNASLSANPPVSGTVYQNTNPYDIEIDLPVYATTSGTAGYVTIAKGSSSTPTAIGNQYVSGDTSSTSEQIIRLRVPVNWYYEFTASGVTFGTASVFAE